MSLIFDHKVAAKKIPFKIMNSNFAGVFPCSLETSLASIYDSRSVVGLIHLEGKNISGLSYIC